jgi:hypothetical protein
MDTNEEQGFRPKAAEDLVIRVDFFKVTGKWYAGGEVNVGRARHWKSPREYMQAIADNQEILSEGWQGQFHVVTDDTHENYIDPHYRGFNKFFLEAVRWIHIKRREELETIRTVEAIQTIQDQPEESP